MNIFDIIGPVMVGPSSSHTAGAVRIGKLARLLLGEKPAEAIIQLHGSFARTYMGHGTDKALVGGLLGCNPDDSRIKNSLELALQEGMSYRFETINLRDAHPNSTHIDLSGISGKKVSLTASSVGGGNILVKEINGLKVEFTGEYPTLLVAHLDKPGMVADISRILADQQINIARMNVFRSQRGGKAMMIIEIDHKPPFQVLDKMELNSKVLSVSYVEQLV